MCVCVIGKLIPALIEAPGLHKIIPARKPCVTDVLCNWERNSQIIKMYV